VTTPSAIRILEDGVINKIAAGEVVERPASVVKELVENAIDAGATEIRVDLRGGGATLIRVIDDGRGMGRADATLCIERHATSKIRSDEDIFRVVTLGFRGEALPSISAVSRFELSTRRAGDDTGTRVVMEGGRLLTVEDAGGPPGTDIQIRTLFFNVPARRKFLRRPSTELSHCLEAVVRQALPRPDLDIEVTHDGKTVIRAPAVEERADRAGALLGPHGDALVPAAAEFDDLAVRALISPVGVHRGSAQGSIYLYVNGRYVNDPVLRKIIREAYRGIVPKGRHPTVILELTIPPDQVDVNVHPAKTEVRFADGRRVIRLIAGALREALTEHGIKLPVPKRPQPVSTLSPLPPPGPLPLPSGGQVPGAQTRLSPLPPGWPARPITGGPPVSGPGLTGPGGAAGQTVQEPRLSPLPPGLPPVTPPPGTQPSTTPPPGVSPQAPQPAQGGGGPRDLLPVPRFIDLRVLGQLARTYVLCEGAGELVIIDQHAAHERITLQRLLRAEREHLGGGQRLLAPIIVELNPARVAALAGGVPALARIGLEVEPFGGDTVVVKQVPAALQGVDVRMLVEDVADDLAAGGDGEPARDVIEHMMATMACHSSIRAGRVLSPYEMRELLRALDQVDFSVCAHGRPVSIRVTPTELERRFHRT